MTLALHRDEFYDVAAGDLTLLQEVVRALAKRLRALVAERPEEARVEGEGVEKPEALAEAETATAAATARNRKRPRRGPSGAHAGRGARCGRSRTAALRGRGSHDDTGTAGPAR